MPQAFRERQTPGERAAETPIDLAAVERWERLTSVIRPRRRLMVAYSGGVDSTLVADAAHEALGDGKADADRFAVAVIGDSPSLPRRELDEALGIGRSRGWSLRVVSPGEQDSAGYRANAGDRCYFCKTHLYEAMQALAAELGVSHIANGTNTDDLGDYRPGLRAADEAEVVSPLVEANLDKEAVRELARWRGLPNADKPAAACLASRVPYGSEVTPRVLARIESAEEALHRLGFHGFRVRDHHPVARVELPLDQIDRALNPAQREAMVLGIKRAGYTYVSLDLEGFRSGSGNATLTIGQH